MPVVFDVKRIFETTNGPTPLWYLMAKHNFVKAPGSSDPVPSKDTVRMWSKRKSIPAKYIPSLMSLWQQEFGRDLPQQALGEDQPKDRNRKRTQKRKAQIADDPFN